MKFVNSFWMISTVSLCHVTTRFRNLSATDRHDHVKNIFCTFNFAISNNYFNTKNNIKEIPKYSSTY